MTDSKPTGLPKKPPQYGVLDATYRAAGGLDGIQKLVTAFYHYMDTLPEAAEIRAMHKDLPTSATKLAYFLSGWMGGPRLYAEHYGPINIPRAHSHIAIGPQHAEAWLLCMRHALADQPYSEDFKAYLMEQLAVPAGRIVTASGHAHNP